MAMVIQRPMRPHTDETYLVCGDVIGISQTHVEVSRTTIRTIVRADRRSMAIIILHARTIT